MLITTLFTWCFYKQPIDKAMLAATTLALNQRLYNLTANSTKTNIKKERNTMNEYNNNNLITPVTTTTTVQSPKRRRGAKLATILVCCVLSGATGSGITAIMSADSGNVSDIPALTQNAAIVSAVSVATTDNSVLTVAEIADVVGPAVVSVNVSATTSDRFGRIATSSGSGSGVILTEDGYILTNNHVVDSADRIAVTLSTGSEFEAVLIGADSRTDLAVIKIVETNLPCAALGDSDLLKAGDLAVAIGNPLGELGGTVTSGIISAKDREITIDDETLNLIQTDAAINPGNSGGALCNENGEVIGIVTAKTSALGIEGLGFAIPVNDAKEVAAELIEKGYVSGRPSIGITTQEITNQTAMFFRTEAGVYAASIAVGGAADNAGVKAGDRIVSLDGQTVESTADLKAIKDKHLPGDTIPITVNRDGGDIALSITLQEEK